MSTKQEKINALLKAYPQAEFGPAHSVVSDGNLEQAHIQYCLGLIDGIQMTRSGQWKSNSDFELEETRRLLERLRGNRDEVEYKPRFEADHPDWRKGRYDLQRPTR